MANQSDNELFPAADYDDPALKLEGPSGERIDAISLSIGAAHGQLVVRAAQALVAEIEKLIGTNSEDEPAA